MSVGGSNWQCCSKYQCRFTNQTGSVCCNHQCRFVIHADSVDQANTVGLFLTASDCYDNTADLLLTGGDGPFVFYCFIIYFNLYFFVGSGFALYTLRRRQVLQY